MSKRGKLTTKLVSIIASVALVAGLMPLPAFAMAGGGAEGLSSEAAAAQRVTTAADEPVTTQDEPVTTQGEPAADGTAVTVNTEPGTGEIPISTSGFTAIYVKVLAPEHEDIHARTLTIPAEPGDFVENVKAKIKDKTGLSSEQQVLFFHKKAMRDGRILADYNVQEGDATLVLYDREPSYTVTLDPGDGSGESIAFRSTDQADFPDMGDAGNCQFAYVFDDGGCVGFNLNGDYCPNSFTAPDGYVFDGWEGCHGNYYVFPSNSSTEATFTAKWKKAGAVNASYTVTYKVTGGTWADETTEDKAETVASGASPASVPTGMVAADGFTGGAWDVDPAAAAITADTTFTYSFENVSQIKAVRGNPPDVLEIYTWADLRECLWPSSSDPKYEASTVKLMNDLDPSTYGAGVSHIASCRDVTIDLNGHTIDRKASALSREYADSEGGVFDVMSNTLTIIDSSDAKTGKITGGWVEDGDGVYHAGGGIYVWPDSALVLQGGTITGNKAPKGGGVYVRYGGRFEMIGGSITGNEANEGGGVYVEDGGTFIADGVSIEGNAAKSKEGGGIKNLGTTSLANCTIESNNAKHTGGGIDNGKTGDLTLNRCAIAENSAEGDGGGVCSSKNFTIISSSFTQNEAYRGGGIHIDKSAGTTNIKGTITVTDNKASYGQDLYLGKGQKLTLTGPIGTSPADKTSVGYIGMEQLGVFTENYSVYHDFFQFGFFPEDFFCTGTGAIPAVFTDDRKEVQIEACWPELQGLIKAAEQDPGNNPIVLAKDYTASSSDDRLEVHGAVTIDLNGHTINRDLSSRKKNGHVIEVFDGGNLTVTDESGSQTGKITGGWPDNGGGIYVNEKANLTIEGGAIVGNHASEDGGGIYVKGNLTMYGGRIEDNQAGVNGGGICAAEKSTLTIIRAQIVDNHSNKNGGGIFIGCNGSQEETTITNCQITGNRANKNGGGIYMMYSGGTARIGNGTKIDNNRADNDGGGVFLIAGTVDMYGGSISGNSAARNGGGVKVAGGTFTTNFHANDVAFDGNEAGSGAGGAIKNFGKTTLTDCDVTNNSSMFEGGGIYNNSYGNVAMEDDDLPSATSSASPGELLLNNSAVTGNRTESNGGGVYSSHKLAFYGGEVSGNHAASSGGGVFVGTEAESVSIEGNLKIVNNTASNGGSDVFLRSGKKFTCTDKLEAGTKIGVELEDGGGIFTNGYKKHNGTTDPPTFFTVVKGYDLFQNISGEAQIGSSWESIKGEIEYASPDTPVVLNRDYAARPKDKPIVIPSGKAVTVDLNGHTLNRNLASPQEDPPFGDGGSVFRVEGQLTIQDSSTTEGTITGGFTGYGGGIYVAKSGTLYLEGGTITGNRTAGTFTQHVYFTRSLGAGICVDGKLYMTGGFITGNRADEDGAGICVRDEGLLEMTGGIVSGNKADNDGGGILVQKGATVHIKESPVVYDNDARAFGDDIYLLKESKLTVTGAFSAGGKEGTGANLGIAVEDEAKVFQDGYVFTDGYRENNPTRDPVSVFTSTDGYTVSLREGEAVLTPNAYGETEDAHPFIERNNQINTNTASLTGSNWMSGISGERYLNEINLPGSHDSGMHGLEVLTAPDPSMSKLFAKTQTRYIEEQLAEGARLLDIRLTPYKSYSLVADAYADDGKNLWLCHGNSWIGGTCLALDSSGQQLSLDLLLLRVEEFLQKNPTETVILNLRPEKGDWGRIYKRTWQILNRASDVNPATGEPYLYKESGSNSYFDSYTEMPQLKNCRGKIVLWPSSQGFRNIVGGLDAEGMADNYFFGGSEYSQLPRPHAASVYKEYSAHNPNFNSHMLPTEAESGSARGTLWEWQLNCTAEDDYYDTYVKQNNTPIENARRVNSELIGDNKAFGPHTTGQYIGWVRMDAFEGKYAEPIWRTNFFGDLDYCTVTVESGLGDPNDVKQVFRVLKGTEITIPGNIYKNINGSLSAWEALDLTDASPQSLGIYAPGSVFKVDSSVTFRAQWLDGAQVPVSIKWKDGNNADDLRPDRISLKAVDEIGKVSDIELKNAEGWRGAVSGNVATIEPDWERIDADKNGGFGEDAAGQYRYEISGDKENGFVLTFIHTPDVGEMVKGSIYWDDNYNAAGERPESVHLKLLADGSETHVTAEVNSADPAIWSYSFGEQPKYADGETIQYRVIEDEIAGYSTIVNGYMVVNAYAPDNPDVAEVFGVVAWDDNDNRRGNRPEKITVRLLAGDREVEEKEVEDNQGVWAFSFDGLPASDAQGKQIRYSISADTIPDYIVPTIERTEGGCYLITYKLEINDDDKKPAELIIAPQANNTTYNGEAQALVTAGACSGGTLKYALGADDETNPDPSAFKADLPTGTEAGTYYAWYYAEGDAFHTDTEQACVTITIGKRPATITVESASKVKGEEDPAFSGKVEGLVAEGDLGEVKYVRTNADEAPGTYKGVLDATYAANPNYDVSVVKGDFAITVPGYSVTFDPNVPASASTACSGTMDDERFAYGERKALGPNAYSLPGYDFGGWNTEVDGTGTSYADGAEVENLTDEGGAVALYAQWSAKPYAIEYWSDGAGSQKHVQTAHFDQPGTLDAYSDASFGWDSGGRTLHGWSGAALGSFYGDGEDFCNLCGAPDANGDPANVALTAEWVNSGQIVVTVTRDGVPQGGLANSLSLTQGSTEFDIPVTDKDHAGTYVFDPAGTTVGGNPAQLPEGTYNLSFNASGYPTAVASIEYGGDKPVSVVLDYYTVSLSKDPVYAGFNEVEIGGGEPVAGAPGAVVALDGDKLNIKTTVSEGYRFEGYIAVGVMPIWEGGDSSKAEQTVEVRGQADIVALVAPVDYSVAVVGGAADKATAAPGETVSITADVPEPGKAFVQWAHADGVEFASADSVATTFAMPDRDVAVEAVFAPIVVGAIGDKVYTGEPVEPFDEVRVSLEGVDLVLTADDYGVSFGDNVDAGDARVVVTMKGPRAGSAASTFRIAPKPATITVESASKVQGEDDPVFAGKVEGLVNAGDLGEVKYVRTNADEAPGTYEGVLDAAYAENPNYDVGVVKGDFAIRALLTAVWLDGDGSVLESKDYAEGDEPPAYDGKEPTKAATVQYSYKFASWDGGTVDGAVTTYRPLFSETVNKYKVIFVDYDGKIVLKDAAEYGYGTPAADVERPADPTRKADTEYTYTFKGWTPEVADVTADAVYTAVYESGKRSYEISWLQDDGTLIDRTTVEYGEVPAHADPAKAATAQYTYSFAGWAPEVAAVTGDAVYKATYTATAKRGTLTFDCGGGTIGGKTSLTIVADVGDVVTIPEAPVRDGYTFKYWKGSEYRPGDKYTVEGDHAFTAVWEKDQGGGGGGGTAQGSSPKTGDALGVTVVLLSVSCVAALCLIVLALRQRRRREE